jgi:methionine-rich copper-binding protein CopC
MIGRGFRAAVLALVVAGFAAFAGSASAATIPVACTSPALTAAINTANGTVAADTLTLAANCTYSYSAVGAVNALGNSALPIVTQPLTIEGNGSTIERTAAAPDMRLLFAFQQAPTFNGDLTLKHLTVQGGRLTANNINGGGVYSVGADLVLDDVTAKNNSVANPVAPATTPASFGGAVGVTNWTGSAGNPGSLDVTGGSITNNVAGSGAGIGSVNSPVAVHGATISDNSGTNGGGILTFVSPLVVDNSTTISGNNVTGQGGGVYTQQAASTAITNSSITGNGANSTGSSGGGIYALISPLTVSGSSIALNSAKGNTPNGSAFLLGGGGIFAHSGSVSLTNNSTVSGNTATGTNAAGGGINAAAAAPVTLTNTSVFANTATFGGGVGAATSQVDATGSSVLTNSASAWGGGLYTSGAALNLTRSHVAGNNVPNNVFFGAGITASNSAVTAKRSSITGNTGGQYGAGATLIGATSTFENSTVAGNSTSGSNTAGGLLVIANGASLGRADTNNSTFSDNGANASTAPGASLVAWSNSSPANPGPAEIHMHNTVVADSDAGAGLGCLGINGASIAPGNIVDEGGNVEHPTTGCPGAQHGDTMLAPLAADPGEATLSMRPKPGSSVIDAGTSPCPATDQRGTTRPQGEGCDSGAYETPGAPDTTASLIGSSPTNDPKFNIGSPDANAASFECRRDNAGAWVACTDPWSAEPPLFGDGNHSVQVRALDADGYFDQSPANVNFVVDHTAPTVTVDPIGVTGDSTPDVTFTVGSDASGIASVKCEVDGVDQGPCTSPYTTPNLSPGSHTVKVHATDNAGNVGTGSVTFTVDTDPPDTIIDSGPTGIFEPGKTNDSTPTFTFHSTKAGSTFECKVDAGAFAVCGSPFTTPFLADGPHTFQVRAKDNVGNFDPTPAVSSFTVAPKCTLLVLTLNPLGIPIKICLIEVRSAQAGGQSKTRVAAYSVRLSRGGKTYLTGSVKGKKVTLNRKRKLRAGVYTVRVTAVSTKGKRLTGQRKALITKVVAKRLNKKR